MKKLTSLFLALFLFISPLSIESFAAESDTNYDDIVAPCYTNLTSISAGITEGVLGFVTSISDFTSHESGKTFVLTCYLQRTDGTYAWENYKSTSETYTSMGGYIIEKSWFAPAGYDYRTYTKLEIKNSSGTVVETATKASGILYK